MGEKWSRWQSLHIIALQAHALPYAATLLIEAPVEGHEGQTTLRLVS